MITNGVFSLKNACDTAAHAGRPIYLVGNRGDNLITIKTSYTVTRPWTVIIVRA